MKKYALLPASITVLSFVILAIAGTGLRICLGSIAPLFCAAGTFLIAWDMKTLFLNSERSSRNDDIPELTDEFVKENFGYNNVEEFRILFRDTVEAQKAYYVESNMYSELWLTVVGNAEVIAYPGQEVERVYGERRAMYEEYAGYYGVDYETFLSNYAGLTDEELYAESQNYVKEDLVMYQLIKELNLNLTEEDYAEGMAFFADYYGATEEELAAYYGEETMRTTILWQALMEKIAETAVITEG